MKPSIQAALSSSIQMAQGPKQNGVIYTTQYAAAPASNISPLHTPQSPSWQAQDLPTYLRTYVPKQSPQLPTVQYTLSPSSARAAGLQLSMLSEAQSDTANPDGDDDSEIDSDVELPLDKLPSLGSAQHHLGTCKRCCFFPKGRCTNGYDCEFCHFDHEKRKRKNKKKKKKAGAEGSPVVTQAGPPGPAPGPAPGPGGIIVSGGLGPNQPPVMAAAAQLPAPPLQPPQVTALPEGVVQVQRGTLPAELLAVAPQLAGPPSAPPPVAPPDITVPLPAPPPAPAPMIQQQVIQGPPPGPPQFAPGQGYAPQAAQPLPPYQPLPQLPQQQLIQQPYQPAFQQLPMQPQMPYNAGFMPGMPEMTQVPVAQGMSLMPR